jgi:hypothetical protein
VGRPLYEHTQAGWPTRVALLAVAMIFVGSTMLAGPVEVGTADVVMLAGATAALVVGWLWSSLTVRIADGALRLQFGLGVPRRTIRLSDIDSLEVTRTRFWDGWGLRRTRRGWLYNVSGYDALLVRCKDGRALLVGTDEPRKLKAALERALSACNPR